MKIKALLGFVLAALAVGYIELRLPPPVNAQGTDAVFQRLATGVLKFKTPLTPAVTALLAASGAASARTYLRGDGAWQGVSPPTYWDLETAYLQISSTTVWTDTGLELAVTTSAGDTVILNFSIGSAGQCLVRGIGGSLEDSVIRIREAGNGAASITYVDVPGAGTHTYKLQARSLASGNSCKINNNTIGQWRALTLLIQVLQ